MRSRWNASIARAAGPASPRAAGGRRKSSVSRRRASGGRSGPEAGPQPPQTKRAPRDGRRGALPSPAARRSLRSGRAAGRARAASAATPPGSGPGARARALLDGLHDGERQAVHPVLGLALGRKRVEHLRASREEEGRVEAACAARKAECRSSASRAGEAPRLPAVESHPNFRERLQGGLVRGRPPLAPRATARTFPRSRVSRTTTLLVSPSLYPGGPGPQW